MTSIWSTDTEGGWKLLPTAGFPDEATLHTLVEQTPQLLPLAGSPRLAIVGREVRLGSGSADLIAIEPSGRVVVIEVKLANNAEARRAVVAQVLAYASRLHGLTSTQLESDVLGRHLRERGYESLYAAVRAANDEQPSDALRPRFQEGLEDSLAEGRFRLVIVLDSAPEDLVHLVGYLEYVTDRLVIDLITVASYQVGDSQVVVPSRVDPERFQSERTLRSEPSTDERSDVQGIDPFRSAVNAAPVELRAFLDAAMGWAVALERRGLASLVTHVGSTGSILRVYIPGDMCIATVNCGLTASIQVWKSVFDRRAPNSKQRIVDVVGMEIGQGTAIKELSPGVLDALTGAYEEAATGKLSVG